MKLDASVVTIREGRTGEKRNKAAILLGQEALMTGDKIFVDVNLLDDEGNDAPDVAPEQIFYQCWYNDQLDIAFNGLVPLEDLVGAHWMVGGQGARKLAKANGNAVVVRLHGGGPGGRNKAKIVVKIGDLIDEIHFPVVD